jgi:Putative auto-transporter adhesin, head GIN domain
MTLSRLILVFCVVPLFLSVTSCKRTVKGEGPVVTKTISADEFTGVSLYLNADVKIVLADTFNCIIQAQQNIADALRIAVDGDEIEISSEFLLKSDEPIQVFISLPVIKRVEVDGSGSVAFVNPAKGDMLRFYINGSGDIDAKAEMEEIRSEVNGSGTISIEGSARSAEFNINGSGDLHAFGFVTETSEITINGSGDAELNATSRLKADVRGSGNIVYKGQPHIISEIIGSGSIKKAE